MIAQPQQPQQPQPIPVAYVGFSAEIVPKTTESLLAACAQLASQRVQVVHLLLTTPGGSVMHGMNLYNVLRSLPFRLITHNVGSVNSIGNVVFLAGEERYACANSTFMFHGVGFDITQPTRLEQKMLREHLHGIEADQRRIASVISARTQISAGEVETLFLEARTKDTDYAKEKGIIHDIRDPQIPPGAPVMQLIFQR